jgi:mRNA-degrading endonuclease RelE of RelBE toxin-antitoxin system
MKSSVLCQTFTASGSSSCHFDPMAFLLADSFQSSLDKLKGEEQKAAKLAAFELQINPANPGLQCHRLDNIRDKNFWSARASRDIRLIFHRVESSLMLCYVDHHDPAYDWASRRKIETHPVTGAAQIVEIRETVREIQIPPTSPSNQPSLRSPSDLSPTLRKPTCSATAFLPSGSRMSALRTTTCCW